MHPQFWPDDLDYAGKRVVVIGSGATAVTLVPAMAETAGHVTMLQRRRPTSHPHRRRNPLNRGGRTVDGPVGAAMALANGGRRIPVQPTPARDGPQAFRKGVEKRSPEGYDIDTHFTRLRPVGTSACAWSPTATCSRPS